MTTSTLNPNRIQTSNASKSSNTSSEKALRKQEKIALFKKEMHSTVNATVLAEQQRRVAAQIEPLTPEQIADFRKTFTWQIVLENLSEAYGLALTGKKENQKQLEFALQCAKAYTREFGHKFEYVESVVQHIRAMAKNIQKALESFESSQLSEAYDYACQALRGSSLLKKHFRKYEEQVFNKLSSIFHEYAKMWLDKAEEEIAGWKELGNLYVAANQAYNFMSHAVAASPRYFRLKEIAMKICETYISYVKNCNDVEEINSVYNNVKDLLEFLSEAQRGYVKTTFKNLLGAAKPQVQKTDSSSEQIAETVADTVVEAIEQVAEVTA